MISKIKLKNFQAHKDSTFELGPITVVKGANNANKTGLIRAAEIALFGKDFPEKFVRNGQKSSSIVVEFSDGRVLTRERNGKSQSTTLRGADGSSESYAGAKSLNDIVSNFSGFSEVLLDKADRETTNLQVIRADAPKFLISGVSPDKVLRRVAGVMGGGSFENSIVVLKREISSEERELEKIQAAIDSDNAKLEELNLPEIEARKGEATHIYNVLMEVKDFMRGTESLKEKREVVLKLESDVTSLSGTCNVLSDKIGNVEKSVDALLKAEEDIRYMKTLLDEIAFTEHELCRLNDDIATFEYDIALLNEQITSVKCAQCGRLVEVLD